MAFYVSCTTNFMEDSNDVYVMRRALDRLGLVFSDLSRAKTEDENPIYMAGVELLLVPLWLPLTEKVKREIFLAYKLVNRVKFLVHWKKDNNPETLAFAQKNDFEIIDNWSSRGFFGQQS